MCGHEIDGFNRAQGDHVIIAATVAHDADRSDRQEHGEGLAGAIVKIVPAQLVDEDRIGAAQQVSELLAHLAEYPHAEAGTGEGVTIDHLAWQSELDSEAANLVLEELAQRLHQFQMHLLGEPADVVV